MSGLWRIYTGPDGQSLIEPIEVTGVNSTSLLASRSDSDWQPALQATRARYVRHPVGYFHEAHPAPHPLIATIVSGHLKMGFGNGIFQTFGPGDSRLMEDTGGTDHTTEVVGDEPCVVAVTYLVD